MKIYPFHIEENGVLIHTRGDTSQLELNIKIDGVPLNTWNATFSVKHYPDDDSYLYQVDFNESTPCMITHNLTADLPYGTYWWDIQITYTDDNDNMQYKTIGAFPYVLKPDVTD